MWLPQEGLTWALGCLVGPWSLESGGEPFCWRSVKSFWEDNPGPLSLPHPLANCFPAWTSMRGARVPQARADGAPYLSLGFVRLHQLHHLSLLHQDDLGVPEPGNVQGLSCDERTDTRSATLQPLQGERPVRVREG